MKFLMTLCTVLLSSLLLVSCNSDKDPIVPSNNITTRVVDLTDFDKINVMAPFTVYVTFSETNESIEVEANENLQSLIQVEKRGTELVARLDEVDLNLTGNEVFNIRVTTSKINQFTGSGEGAFFLQNTLVESNGDVLVVLSGEASINGNVNTNNLQIETSGDANVNLTGTVDFLDLAASGESKIEEFNLTLNKLSARLSGDAKVDVIVNEEIDVVATGESVLRYKGDAIIDLHSVSENAQVIKVN